MYIYIIYICILYYRIDRIEIHLFSRLRLEGRAHLRSQGELRKDALLQHAASLVRHLHFAEVDYMRDWTHKVQLAMQKGDENI